MGVGWELVGSYGPCGKAQGTGMAASRTHPERIPNAFRMYPEGIPMEFFCFANSFFEVMLRHSHKKIVFLQSKT